jgi:hypothetical protein
VSIKIVVLSVWLWCGRCLGLNPPSKTTFPPLQRTGFALPEYPNLPRRCFRLLGILSGWLVRLGVCKGTIVFLPPVFELSTGFPVFVKFSVKKSVKQWIMVRNSMILFDYF